MEIEKILEKCLYYSENYNINTPEEVEQVLNILKSNSNYKVLKICMDLIMSACAKSFRNGFIAGFQGGLNTAKLFISSKNYLKFNFLNLHAKTIALT